MAAKHLRPWIWQRADWPKFHWDSARLAQPLAGARRAQGELTGMARLLDPDSGRHAQPAFNERQRKALNKLLDASADGFVGGMTNKKYAHLTNVSSATAQRDLANLTERGVLRIQGAGRSARYELVA